MQKQLRPYQQQSLQTLRLRLKQTTNPLLVNASVGAGKSLILSELLLIMERAGFRALCLTLNSTLIEQNANTYKLQGGNCSIYCAGLKSKCCENLVVFASPHSVCQGIRNKQEISRQPFNLIIVDEAHNISPHDNNSMYMRILNHYGRMAQEAQYSFRIVGLTGTPYRGKGESIVGPTQLFKEEVCSISTSWLIGQGYLVRPEFGLCREGAYDFSQLRINNMGQFNGKELQEIVDKNERLTGKIMRELTSVVENGRNGAFVFAATRKHCYECSRSLPEGQWAIITGETPHAERKTYLEAARTGSLKYLISVNCLNVGVDIPNFDVCAWLRPTESLILYTQGIGRVLRLHPRKSSAIVLDYAGNLDRHGDIDDPIINAALKPGSENEKDYIIPCYQCNTNNTVHARRCIGDVGGKRCDHYFVWKDCHFCGTKNDSTSRACRQCNAELIDPNKKLKAARETYTLIIKRAEYWVTHISQYPSINVRYFTDDKDVFECYLTNTDRARNVLYAKFVRLHIPTPSEFYPHLANAERLKTMIHDRLVKTPHQIVCTKDEYGRYQVIKKIFLANQDHKKTLSSTQPLQSSEPHDNKNLLQSADS